MTCLCLGKTKGVSVEGLTATIRAAGIRDRRVLEAFGAVPRKRFVPAEWAARAYEDVPLPIPHGQVTTQPSLIARMVEALKLRGDERVLEVGTGYGFQTALLAILAREVWSTERFSDVAQTARANLAGQAIANTNVVTGDGSRGLAEHAPYDGIVVAAAFPRVPRPLAEQVAPGGRLVHPVGPGGQDEVTLFVKDGKRLVPREMLTGAYFVRLVGQHGFASG